MQDPCKEQINPCVLSRARVACVVSPMKGMQQKLTLKSILHAGPSDAYYAIGALIRKHYLTNISTFMPVSQDNACIVRKPTQIDSHILLTCLRCMLLLTAELETSSSYALRTINPPKPASRTQWESYYKCTMLSEPNQPCSVHFVVSSTSR